MTDIPMNAEEFLERCNTLMLGKKPSVILHTALEVLRDPRRWQDQLRYGLSRLHPHTNRALVGHDGGAEV